jgi:hypothetical protein
MTSWKRSDFNDGMGKRIIKRNRILVYLKDPMTRTLFFNLSEEKEILI